MWLSAQAARSWALPGGRDRFSMRGPRHLPQGDSLAGDRDLSRLMLQRWGECFQSTNIPSLCQPLFSLLPPPTWLCLGAKGGQYWPRRGVGGVHGSVWDAGAGLLVLVVAAGSSEGELGQSWEWGVNSSWEQWREMGSCGGHAAAQLGQVARTWGTAADSSARVWVWVWGGSCGVTNPRDVSRTPSPPLGVLSSSPPLSCLLSRLG